MEHNAFGLIKSEERIFCNMQFEESFVVSFHSLRKLASSKASKNKTIKQRLKRIV